MLNIYTPFRVRVETLHARNPRLWYASRKETVGASTPILQLDCLSSLNKLLYVTEFLPSESFRSSVAQKRTGSVLDRLQTSQEDIK